MPQDFFVSTLWNNVLTILELRGFSTFCTIGSKKFLRTILSGVYMHMCIN